MTQRGIRILATALAVAAPLTFAACGGDDDDAAGGGDLEAQVVAKMMEGGEEDGPTQEQAECAAGELVDALGEDRTRELLAAPDDSEIEDLLDADEQQLFVAAAMSCLDVRELMVEQFLASGFSQDDADCVVDALGEDTLTDMASASAAGEAPDQAAIADAVATCGIEP